MRAGNISKNKHDGQIGVQSAAVAVRLLKTLAQLQGPQTLKDFSTAAGLPPAKAHRYLVSLIREGFVHQSSIDGRYDFGGVARSVGRVAINRLDVVRIGTQLLGELHRSLQETVFIGVWGNEGPTVLDCLYVSRPVSVVIRPGSVLPLLTSAFGLVCGAYLPRATTKKWIARELERHKKAPGDFRLQNEAAVAKHLDDIRVRGFGVVKGDLMPGIDAVAVPVIDSKKELIAVFGAVGPSGLLDIKASGKSVRALSAVAQRFDAIIG
jgi:DNA-binding IclR family transcriptional regulator